MICLTSLINFACGATAVTADVLPDAIQYDRKLSDAEQLQVLDMLVDQMRRNHEKIRTWKGEYRFVSGQRTFRDDFRPEKRYDFAPAGTPPRLASSTFPVGPRAGGGAWLINKCTLSFCLDQEIGRCHEFIDAEQPSGYLDVATGAEGFYKNPNFAIAHYIVNPEDELIHIVHETAEGLRKFPTVEKVSPRGDRLFHRRPPNGIEEGYFTDPRAFFLAHDREGLPWRDCETLSQAMRGKWGERHRRQFVQGYAIYVNHELPPVYTIVQHKDDRDQYVVYDGKVGFLPTRKSYRTHGRRHDQIMSYLPVGDVFIPKKSKETSIYRKNGRWLPMTYWSYELISEEINVDIPDAEFSIAQFGLKYGDRLLDQSTQSLYVYDDQLGFVPAEEFQFDPTRVPQDEK